MARNRTGSGSSTLTSGNGKSSPKTQQAKKAHVDDQESEQPKCFVISPIGSRRSSIRRMANEVLERIIEPAMAKCDLQAARMDLTEGTGSITAKMIAGLREHPMCVVLLTGLNPNVMYELGVRHAWDYPVVHIAEKGTVLPYDLHDYETIFFQLRSEASVNEAIKQVHKRAQSLLNRTVHNGRKRAKMISVFGESLETVARQYALEPIYEAKIRCIDGLCTQLRRIGRELLKDIDVGKTKYRPLDHLAKLVTNEFNEFAAQVSVFQFILDGSHETYVTQDHCDGIVLQLMQLQEAGLNLQRKWLGLRGSKNDFAQAKKDIDRLIRAAKSIKGRAK